ncbi:hypothetical protein OIV83_000803 [Microbotryomycetes sp. JL201]|nr:hypothetical protein OIV83_000803 [Microbotryomycetes sp. JL201]
MSSSTNGSSAPRRVFAAVDCSTSKQTGVLPVTPLCIGGGVFGTDYMNKDEIESDVPVETLRLAFQYGMNAIDTSPYYTTSEATLGRALLRLRDEFPRDSYILITKAGRYGRTKADFDYSAKRVRESVLNSCKLLETDYLDGVYMHDVEFVAENVGGYDGDYATVDENGQPRKDMFAKWGLLGEDEAKIHGPGDERVLEALSELFKLKREGKIRAVGFSGYPLPTMLRLARLIAAKLEPLDVIQSYCHFTLQNTSLASWYPLFKQAGVKQIINASPLSMGLLRTDSSPAWHPASPALQQARRDIVQVLSAKNVLLEDVALGFGFASAALDPDSVATPTVVGLTSPDQVVSTMKVYESIYGRGEPRRGRLPGSGLDSPELAEQLEYERTVLEIIQKSGTYQWCWPQGL